MKFHQKNTKSTVAVLCVVFFLIFFSGPLFAQNPSIHSKKWTFFPKNNPSRPHNWSFQWGYNRALFAASDLHFSGPGLDFTIHQLAAKDRPSEFSFARYFGPTSITIPQYNYRLAWKISRRWQVSIGQDHLKYVAVRDQQTTISGEISAAASAKFAGKYTDQPIVLTPDFLQFEHTDGLSLMSIGLDFCQPAVRFGQFSLNLTGGISGGWAVCRTDVSLFGDRVDTDFHVSGHSFQGKTTLELDWKNRLFFAWGWQGGFIGLPDILVKDKKSPIRADQEIWFLERFGVLGVRF